MKPEDIQKTQIIHTKKFSEQKEPALLTLIIGPKQWVGRAWPLTQTQDLGREPGKDSIYIPSAGLSRKHIHIECSKEGAVWVKDLNSTNGSFLNNNPMEPKKNYALKNNDILRLGDIVFKFIESGSLEGYSIFRVQDQIYSDSLCQIHNRKYMENKAGEMALRCKKQNLQLSFVIFDLDHFKSVNDQHSHLGGDFVLSCISNLVRKSIRKTDVFCRIGGEEFALIFECGKDTALELMEDIRKKISSEVFEFEDKKIQITFSAGIAELKKTDQSWKELYRRADKALYKSKSEGRNRITLL